MTELYTLHGSATGRQGTSGTPTTAACFPQYAITADEYKIFQSYDTNRNGRLEIDEFQACMKDLGILDGGRRPGEVRDVVVATFASLDTRKKNALKPEEFIAWYRRANAPKLEDVLMEENPQVLKALKEAFLQWSMFGNRDGGTAMMTSFSWMKLCRDCGMVSKTSKKHCIGTTEADLIFAKVKARGTRKISFSQFVDALGLVAEKSGKHVMHVIDGIIATNGPVANGTVVTVPMYSPKSVRSSTESLRSSYSNGLSVKKSPHEVSSHRHAWSPLTERHANSTPESIPQKKKTDSKLKEQRDGAELDLDDMDSEKLLDMYGKYASFGGRRTSLTPIPAIHMPMDSKQFSKLCRECGLCRGAHDRVKIDLIFTKALTSKARRLMFEDFLVALSMLAVEKNIPEKDVFNMVCESQGPQTNMAPAEFVRLHDETSTYTGIYARGGPDPTERSSIDLSSFLRRHI